jgi:formylglycine-generating enzyme required for sulfatase activity
LYVRCTDSTGKHFQKAITVEAKAYAPPEFNEADFVSFKSGTVTGMFVYNSRVFVSDRVLNIGPFMLARYEVTQALWWDVYQWAISSDRGDNKYTFHAQSDTYKLPEAAPLAVDAGKPQAGIIWNNVVLWLNAFSEMRGLDPVYRGSSNTPLRSGTGDNEDYSKNGYRLPCDAEWEYAARGAVPTTEAGSPWMDLYVGRTAGTAEYRKYVNITGGSADLVGLYRPNIAGLYDMGGNVAEWCGDKFTNGSRYMGITMEDTNVWSPDTWSETSPCAYRVTRGRGYNYTEIKFERPIGDTDGYNSRSNFSSGKAKVTGFRVARTVVAGN